MVVVADHHPPVSCLLSEPLSLAVSFGLLSCTRLPGPEEVGNTMSLRSITNQSTRTRSERLDAMLVTPSIPKLSLRA